MQLEIITYPNPILRKKAAPITEITDEIKELAEAMIPLMYSEDGIGLAAPQVAKSVRMIVVDITGPSERKGLMVMLNPEIINKEGEVSYDEGCLSLPQLRTLVDRAEKVSVRYTTLEGEEKTIDADGLLAICLQHEIDHLDGVLLVDYLSRLRRSMYDRKVKKWQKQNKAANS